MSHGTPPSLALRLAESDEVLDVRPESLVIAGYTGSDPAVIEAHIAELALLGVPRPSAVPVFFPLEPALISTDRQIHVTSEATSGEVEPVLIRSAGAYYLGVGSDHTDREREREDLIAAKRSCPKVLGTTVVPLTAESSARVWQETSASCWSDGQPYQAGNLAQMLAPLHIWTLLTERIGEPDGDVVVFLGTLPLLVPEFRYGKHWKVAMTFPDGLALQHEYDVLVRSS